MIEGGPLVSICIPTYKQTHYLQRNLDSVFLQDFTDYEVVITDDSPDDTVESFVKKYSDKFKGRLRYYRNKIPLGSPENWNYSVSLSNGVYIKILHHDDWFTQVDSLSLLVEAIETHDVNLVFSSSKVINKDGEKFHRASENQLLQIRTDPTTLFFGNVIGAPSVTLLRRTSMLTFDPKIKWVVDLDFYIRIILKEKDFFYISDPLIATLSDGAHQISRTCESDSKIQIFENFYLYNKIQLHIKNKKQAIRQLKIILDAHNVINLKQLNAFGVTNAMIPIAIKTYLAFRPLLFLKTRVRNFIS